MNARDQAPAQTLGWTFSDVDPAMHFATDYADARTKFRDAASRRGVSIESHEHPKARGPRNERLAIDVVVLGNADVTGALIITSGTHGAEGFCGSGCQVGLLADDAFVASVDKSDVAVIMVHALNPYGFAHVCRTTEENVDLNRNFCDFANLPRNDAYNDVHPIVVCDTWPPTAENQQAIGAYLARNGVLAMQQAVTGGQWDRADGLFFGGKGPAWSQTIMRDILRRHAAKRERLGWIDIHTGLGPSGHGEKIFAGPDDAAMIARARAIWGVDVTSIYDGSSTSARINGLLFNAALDECPRAQYAGIALEYGTKPYVDVIHALRGSQWLINHPQADDRARESIRKSVRDAFYVDTPAWKAMVYGQARAAALQALRGLGERKS
ncbi:MAG TPA: M14 family metallopeptidase [Casimicrobiaceae bacterium]|nr:M14 family metallopeptidase [Casimicrobiaceae bacterium]